MQVRRDDRRGRSARELLPGELLGARGIGLLTGLEDRQQTGGQGVAERVRSAGQRDERRHVDVVAAGVHETVPGTERGVGALLDRQPVELRAHGDETGGGGGPHDGEPPGAGHDPRLHRQLARDGRGGPPLGVGELGLCVKPMAQRDGARQLALDAGEQLREQRVSRSRHSVRTARRGPIAPPPRARRA